MRRRTSASISWLETDTSNAGPLHGGRRRTQSGLSHSCDRPTSISPAPRAQTTSVALANNETIRTLVIVVRLGLIVVGGSYNLADSTGRRMTQKTKRTFVRS
jgi:hypothetical protein